MDKEPSELTVVEDPDVLSEILLIADFFRKKNTPGEDGNLPTVAATLDSMGLTYNTYRRWREQGLFKIAMQELLHGVKTNYQGAVATVWEGFDELIAEQMRIARHGKKEADRTTAFKYLYETFVQPALVSVIDPGSEEMAYLKNRPSLNPLAPLGQVNIHIHQERDRPVVVTPDGEVVD